MIIHDISLPISESMVVWPGDPAVSITQPKHLDRGDNATVSDLALGAHTGTHVDAPSHFIRGGSGIDSLDLDILIGPALVVEEMKAPVLSADVLQGLSIPAKTERILFKTSNSELWAKGVKEFSIDFVGITKDGAEWLVDNGVRLVGIDYLSIAPYKKSKETHEVLLNAGIIIIEGLNLSKIKPGPYQLVCLPLNIIGIEGAPARAILID